MTRPPDPQRSSPATTRLFDLPAGAVVQLGARAYVAAVAPLGATHGAAHLAAPRAACLVLRAARRALPAAARGR